MQRKLFLLVLILNLFLFQGLFAQNFNASVSKNPISIGERFEISYSIDVEASNFRQPDFKGLRVLSGPNTSQSVSIVNGNMSRTLSYNYILVAEKEGNYSIDPATITVSGKQIKSNPLKLTILPESEAQKQRRQQEEQQKKNLEEQILDVIKANVFIRSNVSKSNISLGEPFTVTYKLYINPQLNLVDLSPSKSPTFNGFWTQDLDLGKFSWQEEVVDGTRFKAATLKKVVLIPQQDGNLEIDNFTFKSIVRVPLKNSRSRRDPFDMFDEFFGSYRDVEYDLNSPKQKIKVNPLPEPKPESFKGGVGELELEAWFDRTETVSGEPVTLRVKLSGNGNLQLIDMPEINFPTGFELFEPKTVDNINVSSGGISGSRTFEYLVIPRNPGTFNIDPIQFAYYDLSSKSYKTLKSKEFSIKVGKGSGSESSSSYVAGIKKEDVELLGKDIRYIKTNSVITKKDKNQFFGSTFFWLLMLLPYTFFFGFIFYRKKKLSESPILAKNRKAASAAKKRLSSAKKMLSDSNSDKFYAEITKALWGYLSDKLNIEISDLNKDNVRLELKDKISDEQTEEYLGLIDTCEYAKYAPSSEARSLNEIFSKAEKVITNFENGFKK